MKKVILVMMVLILPFVFQSFSKDNYDKNSLVGTEWVFTYIDGTTKLSAETHLKFIDVKNVQLTFYDDKGQQNVDPENATYVVTDSHIVITAPDSNPLSGTIEDNKMTLVDEEDKLTFIKK